MKSQKIKVEFFDAQQQEEAVERQFEICLAAQREEHERAGGSFIELLRGTFAMSNATEEELIEKFRAKYYLFSAGANFRVANQQASQLLSIDKGRKKGGLAKNALANKWKKEIRAEYKQCLENLAKGYRMAYTSKMEFATKNKTARDSGLTPATIVKVLKGLPAPREVPKKLPRKRKQSAVKTYRNLLDF